MARKTKRVVLTALAVLMAAFLCACAPVVEDGLTALIMELPDGSMVNMLGDSSVTLTSDNIGKEVRVSGTKVVDGKETAAELLTYELKEGYNDINVHVSLKDEATETRTFTVYVELLDDPVESVREKMEEREAQEAQEEQSAAPSAQVSESAAPSAQESGE